jgi:hypothetical protein
MKQFTDSNPLRLLLQIVVIGVVVGFFVATFLGTRKPDTQDQDFGAYYRAGQAAIAGRSPYVIDSHGPLGAYMYAPVFAITFFRLLAYLPYLWAVRTFMLLNWVATLLCVRLCLGLFRKPGRDLLLLGVVALLPTFDYLKANLHNGQVGTLLLLCCVGWLCLMLNGRSLLGGLVLSVAVALKLYPALLVPYLLLRRDWKGIAGVTLGTALIFCVPAIFVGLQNLIPLHVQWLKFCMSTQIANQTIRTGNQSLLGVLARLPAITNGRQGLVSADNLQKLIHVYPLIVLLISGGIYIFLFLAKRNAVRDVALLLLWMTIASPRAWTFNFVVQILPAMLMAAAILDRRRRSWLAVVALIGVPVALAFPTNSLSFSDKWTFWAYMVQNKHFDAAVVMAIAMASVPAAGLRQGRMSEIEMTECQIPNPES